MTFVNYQNSNNANTLLIADISASATTLLITEWEQNLFPSQFPFLLTIEHLDTDWNVVLREIVKAISWNQNSFSVVRWFWMCVQDDTASNRVQDNTTHAFSSWDRVSLYRTSEQVKDIQNRLETSANDSAVADEYSSSSTYEEWDIVMYKWDRYICTTAVETAEAFDSTKRTKKSVQLDVSQMQSDIFTLQNSNFASNHLESEWYVWELYSLSDRIFKQFTPTLENSTLDCKIWDTSSNSEIHIQRMWSWTASNQLKLKVKKIWSPTTWLVVEVRRWVEVDVSSSEAYRYWWELIASGSIAYWNITTSYSEITVSLNNEFWWTAWELLDVVVYQTWKTVNASNYYSIACDSTQQSESFSYIAINWVERARSLFMPYCISDWCLNAMLWKYKDWILFYNNTTSFQWTTDAWTSVSYTVEAAWDYKLEMKTSSSYWVRSKILVDWVVVYEKSTNSSTTDIATITVRWLSVWSQISYRVAARSAYDHRYTTFNYWKATLMNTNPIVRWLPNEVVSIWEKWAFTLYWEHINDTFYGGVMQEKSTEATTWSITLWNAVWFITVVFNGEIIKIPYYNN